MEGATNTTDFLSINRAKLESDREYFQAPTVPTLPSANSVPTLRMRGSGTKLAALRSVPSPVVCQWPLSVFTARHALSLGGAGFWACPRCPRLRRAGAGRARGRTDRDAPGGRSSGEPPPRARDQSTPAGLDRGTLTDHIRSRQAGAESDSTTLRAASSVPLPLIRRVGTEFARGSVGTVDA